MPNDNLEVAMKDDWRGPSCFYHIKTHENDFVLSFIIGYWELESDDAFNDIPF